MGDPVCDTLPKVEKSSLTRVVLDAGFEVKMSTSGVFPPTFPLFPIPFKDKTAADIVPDDVMLDVSKRQKDLNSDTHVSVAVPQKTYVKNEVDDVGSGELPEPRPINVAHERLGPESRPTFPSTVVPGTGIAVNVENPNDHAGTNLSATNQSQAWNAHHMGLNAK